MSDQSDGNLVVVGSSAPGIFAAVRAAREGLNVTLVSYDDHLGGILPSLGAIETHYPGVRAPLLAEFRQRIVDHYRDTYGAGSEQFRTCTTLEDNNPMVTYEPSVCERILTGMVEAEPRITVHRGYYPASVELARDRLLAVSLRAFGSGDTLRLTAETFIDATYEGDLAAVAGVPYRVGREAREEFGESHAGRLFTRYVPGRFPRDAAVGKLNLIPKWSTLGLYAGSTGEGDDNIQAYSYRLCITDDPRNRRQLEAPPAGYNRAEYLGIVEDPVVTATKRYALQHRFLNYTLEEMVAQDHLFHGHALPNRKRSWNATNFTGAGKRYSDADWPERRAIARRHVDHALGIMWFLQHDEAMPAHLREQARQWGLARDEFADNGNIPYQMYVREARRIVGRYTLCERDGLQARGIGRTPLHTDSVAITEFPLDSLDCTTERAPGATPGLLPDGGFFLMEQSRPGSVPYRMLLPERLNNLLVSICASTTHVAWATIRQLPTAMHIGEVAGFAAAVARREGTTPGALPAERLQHALVHRGMMISFFNDFDMATKAQWVPAVQYLGTKGFFGSYDALPELPLRRETALAWATTAAALGAGSRAFGDPTERARRLPEPDTESGDPVIGTELVDQLETALRGRGVPPAGTEQLLARCGLAPQATLSRGDACRIIFALVGADRDGSGTPGAARIVA